jgi:hypothetical protein
MENGKWKMENGKMWAYRALVRMKRREGVVPIKICFDVWYANFKSFS